MPHTSHMSGAFTGPSYLRCAPRRCSILFTRRPIVWPLLVVISRRVARFGRQKGPHVGGAGGRGGTSLATASRIRTRTRRTPRDERRTRLDAIAGEGSAFRYTYDFGDGWDRRVVVEKVLPTGRHRDPGVHRRSARRPARGLRRDAGATASCSRSSPTRPISSTMDDGSGWAAVRPEAFDSGEVEDNLRNERLAVFDDQPNAPRNLSERQKPLPRAYGSVVRPTAFRC